MVRRTVSAVAILVSVCSCGLAAEAVPSPSTQPAPGAAGPPPATQPAQPAFGPTVNGLQLGLLLANRQFAPGEKVEPVVLLKNVSDKPQLVLPLLVHNATVTFEVIGPDGNPLRYRGPMLDWDVPDYDKAVVELAPGKTVDKQLSLAGFDLSRPGKYRLTASYNWTNPRPPPGRLPAVWNRPPIWTGQLRSGELVLTVQANGAGGPAAGAPDQAAAVRLAREFLARKNVQPVRLAAFPMPPPVADWWLVEYQVNNFPASGAGPAVFVNRKTGAVTETAPAGMPPRM